MVEPATDRLARVEEKLRVLEAEMLSARQRLHQLGNAVLPMGAVVPELERHDQQIQDLRVMIKAARWMLIILAPLITIATAVTPLLVRYTVRDALSQTRSP